MVLRLILVSIVAGLGATPPAENEIADWSRTVQSWLDAPLPTGVSACRRTREPSLPLPLPLPLPSRNSVSPPWTSARAMYERGRRT